MAIRIKNQKTQDHEVELRQEDGDDPCIYVNGANVAYLHEKNGLVHLELYPLTKEGFRDCRVRTEDGQFIHCEK